MAEIDFEKVKNEMISLYFEILNISKLFTTTISQPIKFSKYALINKKIGKLLKLKLRVIKDLK